MSDMSFRKTITCRLLGLWLFFLYGGLTAAGTSVMAGAVLNWDAFSAVIAGFYLVYLVAVVARLIVFHVPGVRLRFHTNDSFDQFMARQFYRVSLWFAWGFILLCAMVFCTLMKWHPVVRIMGSVWAMGSALFLSVLIVQPLRPLGMWVVRGWGSHSHSPVDDVPELPDQECEKGDTAYQSPLSSQYHSPYLFIDKGCVCLPDVYRIAGRQALWRYFWRDFSDNIYGGLMFTGPAGSGKSTHAGVFAKLLSTSYQNVHVMGFGAPFDFQVIGEFLRGHVSHVLDDDSRTLIGREENIVQRLRLLFRIAQQHHLLVIILDNLEYLEAQAQTAKGGYDEESMAFIRMVCGLPAPARVLMTGAPVFAEALNEGLTDRKVTVCPVLSPSFEDLVAVAERLRPVPEEAKKMLREASNDHYRTFSWAACLLANDPETGLAILDSVKALDVPPGTPSEQKPAVLESLRQNLLFKELWQNLPRDLKRLFQVLCLFRKPVKKDVLLHWQGPVGGSSNLDEDLHALAGYGLIDLADDADGTWAICGVAPQVKTIAEQAGAMDVIPPESLQAKHEAIGDVYRETSHFEREYTRHQFESLWHYRAAGCHGKADKRAKYLAGSAYQANFYADALAMVRDIAERKDAPAPVWALQTYGLCLRLLGYHEDAIEAFNRVLDRSDDAIDRCEAFNEIARNFNALENYDKALEYSRESLLIAETSGEKGYENWVRDNMGRIYTGIEYQCVVYDHHRQRHSIDREIKRTRLIASCLEETGRAHDGQKDLDSALDYLEQSRHVYAELQSQEGETTVLQAISDVHAARGNVSKAFETRQAQWEGGCVSNTILETLTINRFWRDIYEKWAPSVTRRWDKNGLDEKEIEVLKNLIKDNTDLSFYTLNFREIHQKGERKTWSGHVFLTRGEAEAHRRAVTRCQRRAFRLCVDSMLTAEVAPLYLDDVLSKGELVEDLYCRIKSITPYSGEEIESMAKNSRIVWLIGEARWHLVMSGGVLIFPAQWPDSPKSYERRRIFDENGFVGVMDWENDRLVLPPVFRYVAIDETLAEVSAQDPLGFDEKKHLCDIVRLENATGQGPGQRLCSGAVQGSLSRGIWVVAEESGLRFMGVRHPDDTPFFLNEETYEDVLLFNEKRAAVKQNGLWGYIDQDGQDITPCVYSSPRFFNRGYAIVEPTDRSEGEVVIDSEGNTVLDPGPCRIEHHKDDLFFVGPLAQGENSPKSPGRWAVYRKNACLVDFMEIRENVEDELKDALECMKADLRKRIYAMDLSSYLALFPEMTGETDLIEAGLWDHPVRMTRPVTRFEEILTDSEHGRIGWAYPSSASLFNMTKELPVMFKKTDGETLSLGIPIDDLVLEGWDNGMV